MSEYTFTCHCGQKLSCDENLLGKEIFCPICGTKLQLEADKTECAQSTDTSLQPSVQSATETLLCQCYICKHKYDAHLLKTFPGDQIQCPKCHAEIFCQEYKKKQNEYFDEIGFSDKLHPGRNKTFKRIKIKKIEKKYFQNDFRDAPLPTQKKNDFEFMDGDTIAYIAVIISLLIPIIVGYYLRSKWTIVWIMVAAGLVVAYIKCLIMQKK